MSAAALSPAPLAGLLASGGPRAVYQPVVTLPERRVVAYEALARGPGPSAALLLNTEPDLLDAPLPAAEVAVVQRAEGELALVAEITERRIADRPVLRTARSLMLRIAGRTGAP